MSSIVNHLDRCPSTDESSGIKAVSSPTLLGSRPAEPDVFDNAEIVNRTAWSLENNVDDLIKAYRDTPELLDANRLEIARAYGRLCWLVSALQATERKKAESTKFNLEAAE